MVEAEIDGTATTASLPNPGRMQEILIPGTRLQCLPGPEGAKHPWRVVGVLDRPTPGSALYLDTGGTNRVAAHAIDTKQIPALADYALDRREVRVPGTRSRIDFLLRHRTSGDPLFLEVKSCTLFTGRWAMFPDAITERGTRHVRELAELAGSGATRFGGVPRPIAAAILVVVHHTGPDCFLPDYHADLVFSRTLYALRDTVRVIAFGVRWNREMQLDGYRPDVTVPWRVLPPLLEDRGSYLVLLRMDRERTLTIGALGDVHFSPGFYLYVGSAMRNLSVRVARHRRDGRKRPHWHIDYLRESTTFVDTYAIREPWRRETDIVATLRPLAAGDVPGFGASDSPLPSHLLYFRNDPRPTEAFQKEILRLRRYGPDRLLKEHKRRGETPSDDP